MNDCGEREPSPWSGRRDVIQATGVLAGGSVSSLQSGADEPKVTLVFFLGGCTYAEISALRFLSQQDDGEFRAHPLPLGPCVG